MTCPQNVRIEDLSANCFCITFSPVKNTTNDECMYIHAILTNLMDCVGDNFKALIYTRNTANKIDMCITLHSDQ